MGLPEIFIAFETAAVSAIARSARGVLALVLHAETLSDESAGADEAAPSAVVYRTLADVPEDGWSAEDYRLLKLAFKAAPNQVVAVLAGEKDTDTFALLQKTRFDWLAAPYLDKEKVISFIQSQRGKGIGVKTVVADASAPDHEGIVNFCASGLALDDGPIEAAAYTARIAGLLAALPLTRSATYAALAEVVSCDSLDDPDQAIDAGKLIVVRGRDGYKLGRAVNSFTSTTVDKAAPFQKIKIVEGVDLIRTDIARAFENSYIGRVLNDYDNKLLLVTAINAYLRGLEGDVLDKTASNRCFISLDGQRGYLESRGTDTSAMDDAAILRANTGSEVFLEANLTFCDAMEDLSLRISM